MIRTGAGLSTGPSAGSVLRKEHFMEISNRNSFTIVDPLDEAVRIIGHSGMEAFEPIPSTASSTMDIWAVRLEHPKAPVVAERLGTDADLSSVVEEDALTDEPTPDQVEEALEAQAKAEQERAADLGIPVGLLAEFDRLMDSNIPWPDELKEWWNEVGRENEPIGYFDFPDGTRMQVPKVLARHTSSPPLGMNHDDAVAHWMRIIHGITNVRHQEAIDGKLDYDAAREDIFTAEDLGIPAEQLIDPCYRWWGIGERTPTITPGFPFYRRRVDLSYATNTRRSSEA